MTGLITFVVFSLVSLNHGFKNTTTNRGLLKPLSELSKGKKRTLPPAGCKVPEIEYANPIRVDSMPPRSGAWTYPITCKPGYSLIGPCVLICREGYDGSLAFAPPHGLNSPTCVKDYASSQFSCNYLSSICPLVWDHDSSSKDQPSIAISRIFCGQIQTTAPNTKKVFGFGASLYAAVNSYDYCWYKGGIKDDPCYIVRGQRVLPGARGVDIPAITYLGNMDGFEALMGYEDPYIGKLSREQPYYLFPLDVTPSTLVSNLRDYHATCIKRNGDEFAKCLETTFLTSKTNGYDIKIFYGGDELGKGIIDAFVVEPGLSCLGKPCCCDLNEPS